MLVYLIRYLSFFSFHLSYIPTSSHFSPLRFAVGNVNKNFIHRNNFSFSHFLHILSSLGLKSSSFFHTFDVICTSTTVHQICHEAAGSAC